MSGAWCYLFLAGLFEICWALGLKRTQGWTIFLPSVVTLVFLAASMYFLARACQSIPISTAYAVWVGIGTFGVVAVGVLVLKEPMPLSKFLFLSMLIVSIVGLKITS